MERHDRSDGDLCRRALAGDGKAFALLVDRYHAVVWRVAFTGVRDEHLADDLCQDVFLRFLHRLRSGGNPPESMEGFLVTAAANAARDEIRRRRRRNFISIDAVADVAEVEDGRKEEPDMSPAAVAALLPEALLDLSEERRLLVTLRDIQGESYEAIARRAGLPLGTVKSRIHRARLELRDLLHRALRRARASGLKV